MKKLLLLFVMMSGIAWGMEKDDKGKQEIDDWSDEVVQHTNQPTYEKAVFITYDTKKIELTKAEIDRLPTLKNLIEDVGTHNPIPLLDPSATFHTLSALKGLMNAMPVEIFLNIAPTRLAPQKISLYKTEISILERELEKLQKKKDAVLSTSNKVARDELQKELGEIENRQMRHARESLTKESDVIIKEKLMQQVNEEDVRALQQEIALLKMQMAALGKLIKEDAIKAGEVQE
jgi:hypothetical protein